jgi:hypothetical protein
MPQGTRGGRPRFHSHLSLKKVRSRTHFHDFSPPKLPPNVSALCRVKVRYSFRSQRYEVSLILPFYIDLCQDISRKNAPKVALYADLCYTVLNHFALHRVHQYLSKDAI